MKSNYIVERVEANVYSEQLSEFQYSLFITPEWLTSVSDESSQAAFFNIYSKNELIGKIGGLILSGKGLKGKQFYFYAGPAMKVNQGILYCSLINAIKNYAAKHRFSKLNIKSYDQQHSYFCVDNNLKRTDRCEFVYRFNQPEEAPEHKSFLKNVKKAEKVNATIVEDNSEAALNKLIELLDITFQLRNDKHDGTYNPFPYFKVNQHSLGRLLKSGLGKQYVVSVEGEVHCVNFLLIKDGKIFGLIIGSDQFAYDHGFHQFVKYNLMHLFKNSAIYYNLASAEPGSGLANFRVAMGFEEHHVYGAYSQFLVYPQRLFNPLIHASHVLPTNRCINSLHLMVSSIFTQKEVFGIKQ